MRTEPDMVVLSFRSRSSESAEWKSVEQRVPIVWTNPPWRRGRGWCPRPKWCRGWHWSWVSRAAWCL